jgi:hypothetical protein
MDDYTTVLMRPIASVPEEAMGIVDARRRMKLCAVRDCLTKVCAEHPCEEGPRWVTIELAKRSRNEASLDRHHVSN